jgi:hypothetical protein
MADLSEFSLNEIIIAILERSEEADMNPALRPLRAQPQRQRIDRARTGRRYRPGGVGRAF